MLYSTVFPSIRDHINVIVVTFSVVLCLTNCRHEVLNYNILCREAVYACITVSLCMCIHAQISWHHMTTWMSNDYIETLNFFDFSWKLTKKMQVLHQCNSYHIFFAFWFQSIYHIWFLRTKLMINIWTFFSMLLQIQLL